MRPNQYINDQIMQINRNVFWRLRCVVFFSLFLISSLSVSAKNIDIKTITINIDDSFTIVNSSQYAMMAGNNSALIALAAPDWKGFSVKKIFASMDSLCFNLKNATCIDDKRDNPFQWTKDFVTKYYNASDGAKIITHTFYTNNAAYCLLARYNSIEEEKIIEDTIKTIWFNSYQSLFYKVMTTYKYASAFWIICAVLTCFIGNYLKEAKMHFGFSLLIFLLIVGLLLLLTTGWYWDIFGIALSVYSVLLILAYYLGIYISFGEN